MKVFILSDVVASLGDIKLVRNIETAIKRELLYLKTQLLINLCRNRTTAFLSSFDLMVNKIDRPNTTPTARGICKFAVYFSVFLLAFLSLHSCL